MKKAFVYSLFAVLAITGCQAELEAPVDELDLITQESSKVFTATIEDDFSKDTKTSLDESGHVLWKLGDQVSIFAGNTVNEQYQVSDSSDGKTSASLNKVSGGGFVSGSSIDNNVAFYPYASTAELVNNGSSYVIRGIELPKTQTYAEGSFGNGAFPMVAVTSTKEDMNLKFKNVLGGLKLQLKGTGTITSITVTGNNNEMLCGEAEVTVSNGSTPVITLSDASAKSVTLDCGAGVTLNSETATPFIIALPPITMTGGFTVVVADSEGKRMEIKTTKSQTITRSNLLKMPAVTYEGTTVMQPLTFTSTGSTSISLKKKGSPDAIILEYKVDDGEWVSYTVGDAIELADGQKVSFRAGEGGNSTFSRSYNYYNYSVTGSGTIAASGNIMTLLNREGGLSISTAFCYFGLFDGCTRLTSAPELPAITLCDYCYGQLFCGCTGLTSAPELPATTLANHCYYAMFYGCTGLTTAPDLPATTLAEYCYQQMFLGCASLSTAPELPATTLAESCYSAMFNGCTGLTTAPTLPATTLASWCYYGMFNGCTGLTTAPDLPATTLANDCYYGMFQNCTGLLSAPELPATTLAVFCYQNMFYGCTDLITAPELPATTLAFGCYSGMFNGCTKLNYIKALFTTIPSSSYTENWVDGVAATGTFVKSKDATWDVTGVNGVPEGWTVINETPPLTFTSTGSTSISLIKTGSPDAITLEYKVDDSEWISYTVGDAIDLIDGQEVCFIAGEGGNSSFGKSSKDYYSFVVGGSGTVAASGNIMSLLHKEGGLTTPSYCFLLLFYNCSKLTSAPELPATTLAECCYASMFKGCAGLTSAPELPATTLAEGCYPSMFEGCTGLTSAPELPATTLAEVCYTSMFEGCTGLTAVPSLPATTLTSNCYSRMFRRCTGLTSAPTLPATTLAAGCYTAMFLGCTGLTSAPKLPATTLAESCYATMFDYCTGLTSAPTLPATTLAARCYQDMFHGCTGLTSAPTLPATTLAEECYYEMFSGCTGLTSAPSLPATTLDYCCYKYMFYGCTGLTTAPTLPATTLATGCYWSMFENCTGLIIAPELPATTLADYCFCQMFHGCTGLTSAPTLPATTLAERCYRQMFLGCTGLTSAPILPAIILADYCYDRMFAGCTSLTTAPELPATSLAIGCYSKMFNVCTSLTTAPELPATTLVDNCYESMFRNCTKLNYIKALFTTTPSSTYTDHWVYGVSAHGSFVKSKDATWDVMGVNGVPNGWTLFYETTPLTFTATGSTSISLQKTGSPAAITLEYKVGNGEWASYTVGNAIDLTDGQEVSFRAGEGGNSFSSQSEYNYYSFTVTGSGTVAASGSIMSLINKDGGSTIPNAHCFYKLFFDCSKLTSAPELPATTLAEGCYYCMFNGCTRLTTAPELPATTLDDLCYFRMFYDCTSLTSAPSKLPATTLFRSCYAYMFCGCTGLTTAPELPATTLVSGCYFMMFNSCIKLNYIKALFTTTPSSDYTANWVGGVAATGTFVKSKDATWDVTGVNAVPAGWTIVTE